MDEAWSKATRIARELDRILDGAAPVREARVRISEIPDNRFSNSRTAGRRLILALRSLIVRDDFGVFVLCQFWLCAFSAHAVTFQFNAVGIVDDAVEDGVRDGGLTDHLMPA